MKTTAKHWEGWNPANAAVNYGQATREAAIKIAVASFENLK